MRVLSSTPCLLVAVTALCPLASSGVAQEFDLGTLVLSAASVGVDAQSAPASVTVITGEELETAGFTDLTDAIRGVPGVSVAGGADAENIFIRGLPSEYTLVLVDGVRLNSRTSRTNGSGGVDQYYIPPASAIDRVEVVRGPMSSLYGSDAMGGVVNVITKPVAPEWTGSVTLEGTSPANGKDSSQRQLSYHLSGPIAGEKLGLTLWGRKLEREASTKVEGGAYFGADDRTVNDHNARLTWAPSVDHEVFLQFGKTDMSRESASLTRASSEFEDTRRTVALGYNGFVGGWDMTALLAREEAKRETSTSRTGRAPEITTTTLDAKISRPLTWQGEHEFTFGIQVMKTELSDQNLGLGLRSHDSFDNTQAAIFAEDVWALTERLNLTLGARYTDDDTFGGKLTPRAYATYALTDQLTLAGGVSTGYRTPEVREIADGYYSCTGGGCSRAVVPGNPDLKPEESTSYELGLRFDNGTTRAGIVGFHTDFKNRIDSRDTGLQYSGSTDLYEWYNIGKARVQGLELEAGHFLSDALEISGSYTYTTSEQLTGDEKGEPLARTPKHQAALRLDWATPLSGLDAWTEATYFGAATTGGETYDGYTTVDIGARYTVNDMLSVNAAIYNVADRAITDADNGTTRNGRTLWVGLTTNF